MRYRQRKTKFYNLVLGLGLTFSIYCQSYTEGFDDLTTLTDWYIQNNSVSPDVDWGGGDNTIFTAQSGASDSYLSVNYQSSSSLTPTTLSNWLFTPTRTYNNGDVITFFTRTVAGSNFPDRLEVRLSTAGNGYDCGTTATSVGTFTNLLLTINPTLSTTGYPQAWTQYTITISGLSGPTNGRVAFRYYVLNGGPQGQNSNYIGIDSYTYTSVASPPVNDNCLGAINIQQGASCSPTNGSVAYATESLTACSGVANNDVWYSFTANSTGAQITVNGSTEFDAVYEVYTGNCNNLSSVLCVDAGIEGESESGVLSNLNTGQTYYIRVHDWLDDIPNTMNFNICVEQFTQCILSQPIGSINEIENCYSNTNGGCNSTPAVYQTLNCGDTIFGSAWAINGNRDLDWYSFEINSPGNLTWSAEAEFPYYLYIVDISNCITPTIISSDNFNACESGTISYSFSSTGTYAAVISPSTFDNYPCGTNSDYIAWLQLPNVPAQIQSSSNGICPNDTVQLNGSANTIYNWFLNNNPIGQATVFNANLPGNYSATYIDINGCNSTSNIISLAGLTLDNAAFSYSTNTVCSGSQNISALTQSTGTFSSTPPGLTFANLNTGEIDISQSMEGNYSISFLTNGSCPNSSAQNFVITSNPIASFDYSDSIFCVNGQNEQVILGNGSSVGIFSASSPDISINQTTGEINLTQSNIGTYTIYNSIAASGACIEVIDSAQIIIQGPIINFPISDTLCPTSALVSLSASPSGGLFSGLSIENNQFNTALGSSIVTYSFTDINGCTNEESQLIVVESESNLIFGQYADMCYLDNEILLDQGQPSGGIYSGTGVQNNFFDPALGIIGSNIIQYTFTSSNGCTDSITGIIKVNENPQITFEPLSSVCDTSQSFLLSGVTPIGGTFSGPGVSNDDFNPSVAGIGTHQIEYFYTINGCSSTATQTITVDQCSNLNELSHSFGIYPNPVSNSFYLSGFEEIEEVELYSMEGKKINLIVRNKNEFDISQFPQANYLLKLKSNNQTYYFKLIKL